MVAVLQTVECTVHALLKERLGELELLYGQYDIYTLCEAMNVSRETFYNHILRNKQSNAWFEKRKEEYCGLIREVFNEYRQVLGAEKIRTILVQRGHQISTEYVARLMKEMGLASIRTTTKQDYMKLHERAAVQSFYNSGKPHDNAVAESFFATLKKEDLYRKDYTSEVAFKRGIASYIEFYNTQRPHRTLKNLTPCQVEDAFMSDK